ncbi:MAG: flagellar basal body L-ring protein FlgH [Armatimonadota bacterium]|nr:flagellar basal body L-ring protein FlgH [Armatimonadota bacterium]
MRTNPAIASLILLACLFAAPGPCPAESLWRPNSRSVIADRTAARPGDIVTVLIVQRSTTSHKATHKADKKLDVSGGPGGGLLQFFPDLSLETERSTDGSGATTQSTSLVDRLSGLVVGVTPEGNLQIEASRRVNLNADELTLTLTGLVRPDDISPDNTILSTQIADCQMGWSGSGPITEKQRPGLISRLLSILW